MLARTSQHGSGRAGLQPRRYKAFLIIPVSRAPRSPRRPAASCAGRGTNRGREPPFRQPPKSVQTWCEIRVDRRLKKLDSRLAASCFQSGASGGMRI